MHTGSSVSSKSSEFHALLISRFFQSCIQNQSGDIVFCWGLFLNTSNILLIYCVLFCTLSTTSFQLYKMFFWIKCSEADVYLRNLSESNNFLFLIFIFGELFLGIHNIWALPFSGWAWPRHSNFKSRSKLLWIFIFKF